jgi:uncharacterized membrane protein
MEKRKRIVYWIFTVWASFGMGSTGIMQLMRTKTEVDLLAHLGFPVYLLTILGAWKVLGSVAILVPKFALLKEWAYAGFLFAMTGAACSHLAVRDSFKDIFPSLFLLVLTGISWHFRPADRRAFAGGRP